MPFQNRDWNETARVHFGGHTKHEVLHVCRGRCLDRPTREVTTVRLLVISDLRTEENKNQRVRNRLKYIGRQQNTTHVKLYINDYQPWEM